MSSLYRSASPIEARKSSLISFEERLQVLICIG